MDSKKSLGFKKYLTKNKVSKLKYCILKDLFTYDKSTIKRSLLFFFGIIYAGLIQFAF